MKKECLTCYNPYQNITNSISKYIVKNYKEKATCYVNILNSEKREAVEISMALSYKFISLSSFSFFFLLFSVVNGRDQAIRVFNVKDYGAVANGKHNDTKVINQQHKPFIINLVHH